MIIFLVALSDIYPYFVSVNPTVLREHESWGLFYEFLDYHLVARFFFLLLFRNCIGAFENVSNFLWHQSKSAEIYGCITKSTGDKLLIRVGKF